METFKRAVDGICIVTTVLMIVGAILYIVYSPNDILLRQSLAVVIVTLIIAGIVAYATKQYKKTSIVYCRIFSGAILISGLISPLFIKGTNAIKSYEPPPENGYLSAEIFKCLGKDKTFVRNILGEPNQITPGQLTNWGYTINDNLVIACNFIGDNDIVEVVHYVIRGLPEKDAIRTKDDIVNELNRKGFSFSNQKDGYDNYKKGKYNIRITLSQNDYGSWYIVIMANSYN